MLNSIHSFKWGPYQLKVNYRQGRMDLKNKAKSFINLRETRTILFSKTLKRFLFNGNAVKKLMLLCSGNKFDMMDRNVLNEYCDQTQNITIPLIYSQIN